MIRKSRNCSSYQFLDLDVILSAKSRIFVLVFKACLIGTPWKDCNHSDREEVCFSFFNWVQIHWQHFPPFVLDGCLTWPKWFTTVPIITALVHWCALVIGCCTLPC